MHPARLRLRSGVLPFESFSEDWAVEPVQLLLICLETLVLCLPAQACMHTYTGVKVLHACVLRRRSRIGPAVGDRDRNGSAVVRQSFDGAAAHFARPRAPRPQLEALSSREQALLSHVISNISSLAPDTVSPADPLTKLRAEAYT